MEKKFTGSIDLIGTAIDPEDLRASIGKVTRDLQDYIVQVHFVVSGLPREKLKEYDERTDCSISGVFE